MSNSVEKFCGKEKQRDRVIAIRETRSNNFSLFFFMKGK